MRNSSLVLILSVVGALALSACGDSASSDLAIQGQYVDSFGNNHEITQDTWTNGDSTFAITQFSNDTQMVIAQNGSANEYNPDQWSRFDWTENADGLWYCQSAYGADTEEAAMNTAAADATDPATTGCGGTFEWTKMEGAGE